MTFSARKRDTKASQTLTLHLNQHKRCIGNGVLPAGLVSVKVMDVPVM